MENTHPHAHPTSSGKTFHGRSRSITSLPLNDHSPKNSTSTPRSAPHNRQQRLLHTRHARFSAQNLSFNGLTFPQISRPSENETTHFTVGKYHKPDEPAINSDKSSELTGSSPSSTILNEIAHFTASRHRSINTRAPIPIFQDSPTKLSLTGTVSPSIYQDAPNEAHEYSTESPRASRDSMGLKEVSINVQRSLPKSASPCYSSPRTSVRRKSSQARLRFNSEEYIQHIENELQMVKDAMYSPNTHLPWKEKLKKAKEENEQLRKELETAKVSFEYELQETVERLTANELSLKRRIRDLQEDVEQKQTTIQVLEYEHQEKRVDLSTLETLKARIEKLEEERNTLELTNKGMTKRNEVLTQLLALSPTKANHGIELPTPRRRSARPMSLIIPRNPSSPVERTPLSRPQSVLISPGQLQSDYFPRYSASSPPMSSPNVHRSSQSHSIANDDIQSIDSGLGESCANPTNGITSRRSTLASHLSSSPELVPTHHAHGERPPILRQPSKRRPRKFMPGSTQLKPLLLPTFTAENGHLPSTSPVTSPNRVTPSVTSSATPWLHGQYQAISDPLQDGCNTAPDIEEGAPGPSFQSLDEVFARMGETLEVEGSPHLPTPVRTIQIASSGAVQLDDQKAEPRPRVTSWVLKTMSECRNHDETNYSYQNMDPDPEIPCNGANPERAPQYQSSHRSTSNVSSVEIPRPLFSQRTSYPVGEDYLATRSQLNSSPLNPRKRRKAGSRGDVRIQSCEEPTRDFHPSTTPKSRPYLVPSSVIKKTEGHGKKSRPSSLVLRQGNSTIRGPLEMLQHRNIGARPFATMTIQTVYATLSRYTSYIQSFKKDPLALARRVIANAWRSNWTMFGKMSWWVLGLFIGFRQPDAEESQIDWELYDGESIAHRYCSQEDVEGVSIDDGSEDLAFVDKPEPPNSTTPQNAFENPERSDSRGWGKSVFLWGKFSVAIMLAIGGAIVKGPAEMLKETEDRRRSRSSSVVKNFTRSTRDPAHEQILTPDHTRDGFPSSWHDDAKLPIISLGVVRKVRSFSSPSPSSRYHDPDVMAQGPMKQSRFSSEDEENKTPPCNEDSTREAGENFSYDDTLKPKRTERTGIESFFQTENG